MELIRAEGVYGKTAVAMADKTTNWLYKVMRVRGWR